jgi:hypothetical protein
MLVNVKRINNIKPKRVAPSLSLEIRRRYVNNRIFGILKINSKYKRPYFTTASS